MAHRRLWESIQETDSCVAKHHRALLFIPSTQPISIYSLFKCQKVQHKGGSEHRLGALAQVSFALSSSFIARWASQTSHFD